MKYFLIILFSAFANTLDAQFSIDDSLIYKAKKINMQTIKDQSYLKYTNKINCDSTIGTSIEERICVNFELQKQDSLLHCELDTLINECKTSGDNARLQEVLLSQELWERYRYAHCRSCIIDGARYDMIMFMRCATELTIKRREDVQKMCGY